MPEPGDARIAGRAKRPAASWRRSKRLLKLHTEDMALDQAHRVFGALLAKVRDFQEVAEDVVAVVTQQRVGVKHKRGEAGDQHRVKGELVDDLQALGGVSLSR